MGNWAEGVGYLASFAIMGGLVGIPLAALARYGRRHLQVGCSYLAHIILFGLMGCVVLRGQRLLPSPWRPAFAWPFDKLVILHDGHPSPEGVQIMHKSRLIGKRHARKRRLTSRDRMPISASVSVI